MIKQLFCLLMLCCALNVNAQKLKKNTVDKFNKTAVKETSSETLFSVNFLGSGFTHKFDFVLRYTDGKITMPASILLPHMEKYDEDSCIKLLLSNDETIELTTLYTGISKSDGKGYSFDTCFRLSEDDVQLLKENDVVGIRISYLGGHYDRDIKEKKQGLIKRMLELFD